MTQQTITQQLVELKEKLNNIKYSLEERQAMLAKLKEIDIYDVAKAYSILVSKDKDMYYKKLKDADLIFLIEEEDINSKSKHMNEELIEFFSTCVGLTSYDCRSVEQSSSIYMLYSPTYGIIVKFDTWYDSWNSPDISDYGVSIKLLSLDDFTLVMKDTYGHISPEKFLKY